MSFGSEIDKPEMGHAGAVESIAQFTSMWGRFVNECGDVDNIDLAGLAIRWAESPFAFWNLVFLTEPEANIRAVTSALRDASEYMRGKARTGFVCVCEEFLDAPSLALLPALVDECGLKFALTMSGMAAETLPVSPPVDPELRIERVTNDRQLQIYADINSDAYSLPHDSVRAALSGSRLWKERMHSYVAHDADGPVSAAAAVENEGCLFLALVATIPAARRKGYSKATILKALSEAARSTKLTRSILHATEAGFPIYERLGYRKTATIHAYTLKT